MTPITNQSQYPSRTKAWVSTAIIFLLTAIAMADRMAISMLIGPIKQDFGIGDFQASLLIGFAFMCFYVLFLLPIGAAADKFSRAKVLGVCLFVWSLATLLCGFATGFISLFIARMIMGAGEAGIGPCSHGIIGASFPRASLSKPLAVQGIGFQVGPAVGVAAAGAILAAGAAGTFDAIPILNDLAPWRVAFILIGLPGFLALLLIPFLHDPTATATAKNTSNPARADASIKAFIAKNRLLVGLILCSSSVSAMGAGTVLGWAPEYLQRSLGVAPAAAGAALGLIMLFSAIIGQGSFSIIVDWLAARGVLDAPVRAGLLPAALSIPAAWLAMSAEAATNFYWLLFAYMLCMAPLNSVNNTTVQQIAPPSLRSRLSAIIILAISLLGFVVAPSLVGALSEFVFGEAQLGLAMKLVMTIAMVATLILYVLLLTPLKRYMETATAN